MNINRFSIFCLLIAIVKPSLAQLPSSAFVFQNRLSIEENYTGVIAESDFSIGSNTLNAGMINDYLFSNSFKDKNTEAFKNSTKKRCNLYTGFNISTEIYLPGEHTWAISMDFADQLYYSSSKPLAEMLLFGNKKYAGIPIASFRNEFIDLSIANINVSRTIWSGPKAKIRAGLGISSAFTAEYAHAEIVEISTAIDGSYIDINSVNAFYNSKDNGVDGIGINISLAGNFNIDSSSKFSFMFEQIGPIWFGNDTKYGLDTLVHFEGLELNANNFEAGVEQFGDSLNKAFLNHDPVKVGKLSLPLIYQFKYEKWLNANNGIQLNVSRTGYSRNFVRSLAISHLHSFNGRHLLQSEISVGTFTALVWSEKLYSKWGTSWQSKIELLGLNACLLPRHSSFYGIAIGFAKSF